MNKRQDLQCLRALAILAVIAFHLEPKIFPYGYLGVDIFFVISGYLMTLIISKTTEISTFYMNRIKRIIPIYLFVIQIVFVLGFLFFLTADYSFLKAEVLCSVFFVNNLCPIFHQKQYFEMLSEYKFLLHTWSLGVEIQFYLIAPFLLKFLISKNRALSWTLIISTISFLLSIAIPNEAIAFGLVFCRIWQFSCGTFVFILLDKKEIPATTSKSKFEEAQNLLEEDEKEEVDLKQKKCKILAPFLFVILIVITFMPVSFDQIFGISVFLRIVATLFAGIFIAADSSSDFLFPPINTILAFIGDISYVVYLVHWPIILFFKYFSISYGFAFTFICIFMCSILFHKLIEIPLQQQSLKFNFCCIIILYCITALLFCIHSRHIGVLPNAVRINEAEAESCKKLYYECEKSPLVDKYYTVRPPKGQGEQDCSFQLDANSTKTVMLSGNSYMVFQLRGILDAVKQSNTKFSEAFLISYPGCSFLAGKLNHNNSFCVTYPDSFELFLNATKPDVIIHSSRFNHFIMEEVDSENFTDEDFYFKEFKKSILHVASFTRLLIIIEPTPHFLNLRFPNPLTIARTILVNGSTAEYNITVENYRKNSHPTWNRIKKAVEFCPNCVIIPTEHLFCSNGICPMVDPVTQISRYCDESHITASQSILLTPYIIKVIDDFKF